MVEFQGRDERWFWVLDLFHLSPSSTQHTALRMHSTCRACGRDREFAAFSGNHWLKPDGDPYKRCRDCVKGGRFNASGSWMGTPKDPLQILFERGWIDPKYEGMGKEALDRAYPPEKLGKIVLGLPDCEFLLSSFEEAGHHGWGGLGEGLCAYPGCVERSGLLRCGGCRCAHYCGKDHQREHWKIHKAACKEIKKIGAYSLQREPIKCVKCSKTGQPRYGYVPDGVPGPWFDDGRGGRLMCGKCACYLGIGIKEWIYSHPDNWGVER